MSNPSDSFERMAAEFYRETGLMAPGKDAPDADLWTDEREARWKAWNAFCERRAERLLAEHEAFSEGPE